MANGLKETTRYDNKWKAESESKKSEGWGQDGQCFILQLGKQSMLGSVLKAWSVLTQKRSYISEKQTKHMFGWIHKPLVS